MEDVGFFSIGYGLPDYCEHWAKAVRKHYPKAPILLWENSNNELKDVCEKYNIIHKQSPHNFIRIPKNKEEFFSKTSSINYYEEWYDYEGGEYYVRLENESDLDCFIKFFKEAANTLNTEWIVFLERDMFVRKKLRPIPNFEAHAGLTNVNEDVRPNYGYEEAVKKWLPKNTKENAVKGLGIYKRSVLKNILDNLDIQNLKHIFNYSFYVDNDKSIRYLDTLMSFIISYAGYQIEDWNDLAEPIFDDDAIQKYGIEAAIWHGIKPCFFDNSDCSCHRCINARKTLLKGKLKGI
tara:strand:+ start:6815 stop:7693 length:879 start_codon:yes stop_codon:yes gene_type:complete